MSYSVIPTVATGEAWPASAHNKYIRDNFAAGVPHIFAVKGDIAVATGTDAAEKLSVGANDKVLVRDDAEDNGAKWDSNGLAPIGGIVIWSGSTGSIPTGWQICDGTNGTPNLRDKFIPGAGTSYASGNTGGAATVDMQHNHTVLEDTDSGGGHTHTSGDLSAGAHVHTGAGWTSYGVDGEDLTNYDLFTDERSISAHRHTATQFTSDSSGAHAHTGVTYASGGSHTHNIPASGNSLSTTQSILPPYYALAYIMRMS